MSCTEPLILAAFGSSMKSYLEEMERVNYLIIFDEY